MDIYLLFPCISFTSSCYSLPFSIFIGIIWSAASWWLCVSTLPAVSPLFFSLSGVKGVFLWLLIAEKVPSLFEIPAILLSKVFSVCLLWINVDCFSPCDVISISPICYNIPICWLSPLHSPNCSFFNFSRFSPCFWGVWSGLSSSTIFFVLFSIITSTGGEGIGESWSLIVFYYVNDMVWTYGYINAWKSLAFLSSLMSNSVYLLSFYDRAYAAPVCSVLVS